MDTVSFTNLSTIRAEARSSSEAKLLGWNIPPHELRYIPDHWLTGYPDPEASIHYLLAVLYVFLTTISMVGNGLVMWVFASAKSLRTPSNILVINLAFCDFFMMSKTPIFIYNSFNRGYALGHLGCQIYGIIGSYTGIGASLTNAFIAYDRYNVITRPLEGKMTTVKAVVMVSFVYLYATPWSLSPAFETWGRFVPGDKRFLGWNIPPDELEFVPTHWLTQYEPEEYMHYVLAIIYILFTFASLIGNGLVIWIFMGAKSLRTPSNIFVVNLAIFDFLMMIKTPIFIYNSFNFGFAMGNLGCQIFAGIGSYAGIGAAVTNALIGYDRRNVIARPMDGKLSYGKAIFYSVLVWLYCTPWALMPLFKIWGRFVPGGVAKEQHLLGWNVPAEELQYIPEHWLTQREPEQSMHYLLAMMYIAFMFAAVIGNGLVIWVFMSAKSLRTPSNLFVINLAIFDFIMMCKAPIFIYNSMRKGFALGNAGCQLFAAIGSYSGIGAGMTNAFIGYDRYNVIARPMDGKLSFTKALIINILIWVYCTPWVLLPLFQIWGRFVPEGYLTSCTFDYLTDDFDTRLFVGVIFFCSFCMPMTMIIYYYSQIVSHVFAHEKTLREQAKKMNVESLRSNTGQNKDSAEIRIAKAAITICFLFVCSWTPYGVMSLIGAFGDKSLLTPGVTMIPACTCKMVACIDPYVYAISHPRYRMELQKRLPWLAINEKAPETASTVSTNTATENQTTAA